MYLSCKNYFPFEILSLTKYRHRTTLIKCGKIQIHTISLIIFVIDELHSVYVYYYVNVLPYFNFFKYTGRHSKRTP
jgi:hypothetical protein